MKRNMHLKNLFISLIISCALYTISIAQSEKFGAVTGFPLPRFVSTKSIPVNVRAGPGRRYPIKVVFRQKVPVKIIDEYGNWRKIKDWEGEEGWIHRLLLGSRRLAVVMAPITGLHEKQSVNSAIKARLSQHVIVTLQTCNKNWCYVDVPTVYMPGYVRVKDIWGVLQGESIE